VGLSRTLALNRGLDDGEAVDIRLVQASEEVAGIASIDVQSVPSPTKERSSLAVSPSAMREIRLEAPALDPGLDALALDPGLDALDPLQERPSPFGGGAVDPGLMSGRPVRGHQRPATASREQTYSGWRWSLISWTRRR
jgi:hypothetical protein